MGAVTTKALAISNADQQYPKIPTGSFLGGGRLHAAVGQVAVGAGDSAGSQYRFLRVPSGARIHRLDIFSDAIAGFTNAKVGVYDIQNTAAMAGAAKSDNLFGTGIDLSVGQTEPYDVLFNNLGIGNIEKRLWEMLGLSADPLVYYDIVITSLTQTGGTGNLAMRGEWVV